MEKRRLIEFRKPRTGELLSFRSRQYYVSEDGQVYDGNRRRYVALLEKRGYMAVHLIDDDGKWHTSIMVHNLVASCFIRLLNKGVNVHHIDHDKKNNNISNLEIIDVSEHHRMHWQDGTMDGVATKISKKLKKAWRDGRFDAGREKLKNVGNNYMPAKQVAQLTKDGQLVRVWPSTAECGRNGYNFGNVATCCRGERKTHKGFRWQWYEDFQKEKEEAQQLELSFSE